ncbi:putative telomere-length maintenance and DNA damage repair [Lyophyllum shimeji]|uniref:Serine/threonine-protein kinase Tel1 n=1 Tax=Lyophyllum shimeji TaxID=47721 RepID=A0A9P3PUS7_LYOSH|nr:putative telomere-length maintenance and DNA damage repair [Lyophyllum shimeji]
MRGTSQVNLKDVLNNLKSTKIKERQEALSSFRTIFERTDFVNNFHINSEGEAEPRAWLAVFQALFEAVLTEKLAATKKETSKSAGSTATAQRRLEEAASTVRWLTERTVHLLNKRVTKSISEHLLQTMVHRGELLTPVALHYTKALRSLASYTPHLEHMEDDTWVRMVEMSFNILLGDPVRSSFEDDAVNAGPAPAADDSDLFVNDDSMDHDDALPSTSRKRGRADSNATPGPSSLKAPSQSSRKSRTVKQQVSVSHEQVECMSLLSVLLQSPSSPIISTEFPRLASSILMRLQRFLDLYTGDTSLLHDYITTLSSTLSNLSLNRTHDVAKFARESWDKLLDLWGTKNKRIKEGLVSVLHILIPFITTDNEIFDVAGTSFDCAGSLSRVSTVLAGEAESRWGVDALCLDCLRLELVDSEAQQTNSFRSSAFVARTFRFGWNFDAAQALAWAILELQADCIAKLFQISEAIHTPSTPRPTFGDGKRLRLENPITSLLATIQSRSTSNVRAYHLQILLFVIDRHWDILHDTHQQDIINVLLQFTSLDDGVVQSWVFLCFAAIASVVGSSPPRIETSTDPLKALNEPDTAWDSIWTSAIRRANVPAVSRAACHAAYLILRHTHAQTNGPACLPLASAKILFEIETLAKDLDVQGPPYPSDSVCTFLACCLKVASQDMHLYRMQLEEKVLSWLVDCWKVAGFRRKTLSLYMVRDLMLLLECICGLSHRSDLINRVPLPEGQIVDTLVSEATTKVIKDFVLAARLPRFQSSPENPWTDPSSSRSPGITIDTLTQPRGRERRVSAFLLKSLERLISDWDESTAPPTAETARQSLDMAVTALSFESALVVNGTQSDRRLIQCACRLIRIVTALLPDARWTAAEKALISLGLDPLTFLGNASGNEQLWSAMLLPDIGSGIKAQTLSRLSKLGGIGDDELEVSRMSFLRVVWQHADVQSVFNDISDTLRNVLRVSLGEKPLAQAGPQGMDVDEQDGFGPIRTVAEKHFMRNNEGSADVHSTHFILDICVSFLTVGPALQSASGEPTRDKDLIQLILNCAEPRPEAFLSVFPMVLQRCRQKTLNLSVKSLDSFLNELSRLLQLYQYGRSHRLQSLATQFLASTMEIWASPDVAIGETLDKVRQVSNWLSAALRKRKIRSWAVRDLLARFFDQYLVKDPTERAWNVPEKQEVEAEALPSALLPIMGADDDMRVRCRVAVLNARLFALARRTGRPTDDVYVAIKRELTVHLESYEHMLTRILSLGNVMVMGSAARRGAYWHLLETCLYTPVYAAHMEAVLRGVSERMGLTNFSSLFEAYASQLAYSIRQSNADFLRFPPHLLGYKDRKECALANFRSFTPTNIWNGGRTLFENHCKAISKSLSDGLRICFGDVLGYQIVTWIDEHDAATEGLGPMLRSQTFQGAEFDEHLAQNVDSIVVSILRTLGDQDVSETGPIVRALRGLDSTGHSVTTFCHLMRYRKSGDLDTHPPSLPAFPAETVLQALQWLRSEASIMDEKATSYHVLRQLFAEVDRSPLVNEQVRLMNVTCLWTATHSQDFQDIALLHTLIHGATALLGQSDLARSAQSMLDWGFSCYRKLKTKHPRIPDILVRISCLAYDYSRDSHDAGVATMGLELLKWIDTQAYKLSQVPSLSSQVMKAIPAWPHQPSPQLAQLCESITGEHLSSVLGDHRIASSKFRLVRRLRDHALSKDYSEDNFAQSDFWRLKESIPPPEQLQDADIEAFAGLLSLNKGRLDSFRSETSSPMSILQQHRRGSSKSSKGPVDPARESITVCLLAMVHGDSASRSNAAYETLRLIKAVEAVDLSKVDVSSTEHSVELEYLEKYRRSPKEQISRDIDDLLTGESYLDSVGNFPQWIAQITTLLSEVLSTRDAFYAQMLPILQTDTVFAEQVFPILVYTLLAAGQGITSANSVPRRTILSKYFTCVLTSHLTSVRCLRSVIDVVLHLRHFEFGPPRDFSNPMAYDALSYNKWLDLDFMLLARCSISCGAYTTALLFLELAAERRRELPELSDASQSSEDSEVLYEIYRHIDEPDGFYGIHDPDLHQNLIKRFHHENQWERAFRFHGAAFEAGDTSGHAEGLVKSFHSFGFDHLANDALRNGSSVKLLGNNPSSHGVSFRLAWRTETWDLPECDEKSPGASLYLALRTIYRERDEYGVDATIRRCLVREMDRLRALGSENFAEIREVVRDIMCLHEIVKWRRHPIQACLKSKDLDAINWDHFIDVDPDFEFSNLENIMAIRISLIRSARQKAERQQIGTLVGPFTQGLIDIENRCLVQLSKAARASNQVQIALNSVVRAQRLERIPPFAVFEEFASVLWCQKEEKMAVEFLDRLRLAGWKFHVRGEVSEHERALALARLGSWSSAACLKTPEDIQKDYFTTATSLLNTDGSSSPEARAAQATVYHDAAIFAERQYYDFVKSPDAVRWKIYVERKEQEIITRGNELKRLVEHTPAHTSLKHHQEKAEKLLKADTEAFRKYNRTRDAFLKQAIDMYSRSLEVSDAYDGDAGIRLCSLWFANFEEDATGLQEHVGAALERVPSRKFVFLSHQLSARISNPLTGKLPASQRNLQSLVLRMCKEHPFHSLYQVYCLQPGRPLNSSVRRQSGRTSSPAIQSERSAAAGEIFDRLRADGKAAERLLAMEQLCDACVQWAKYPIKGNKSYDPRKPMKLPKDVKIGSISNLRVPVITHHTPIDATMQYNDCPWIDHYELDWTVAGGINLPKINTCVGTDGVKYKQLFKGEGEDDLRQDAVMEQVFGLVNGILRRDRETRRRSLGVRDYKVIPLASQAGLLEFVGNTLPLARWLLSAHQRYHPDDMSSKEINKKLQEIQGSHKRDKDGVDNLVKAFTELQKRVRPVMRHFFTEKHKTPISWFAMRLNYTRSVATTSIVGHILGLGDRHTSNILMDNASGQVVHIDLGIAFDQGKLLRVPELVPFRMTRDIVDGMGMSKTSGVFQRCAEETLRVLRDGSEVIMTVLEVFKHDPLHSWTASETKINRVQQGASAATVNTVHLGTGIGIDMSSGGAEEAADRALSSVFRKLDKSLSVQSAVTQLVREATDPRNLSQIYYGWYPLY